ncbi:MAG TPA: signal peptidase I, partial [Acidimicrobiales bacterium]|nr:signal peptidase I [Acidimicrobiales bacterium]
MALTRTRTTAAADQDEGISVKRAVLSFVLVAFVLAVAGGLAYLRTFPPMATVMSESMQPSIAVGDIVLFKDLGGEAPEVGDVVEVSVPAELQREHGYPGRVIHRVVKVDADGTVTTKGDNLDNDDPFTTRVENIDRRVVTSVPMAGRLLGFIASPFGLLWIAMGLVVFVVMPFYDVQRERSELHQIEVAGILELQQKVDQVSAWTLNGDGRVQPFHPSRPDGS